MQGLIERSVCNSADVAEDDLITEIGKQDAQIKQNQDINANNPSNIVLISQHKKDKRAQHNSNNNIIDSHELTKQQVKQQQQQ